RELSWVRKALPPEKVLFYIPRTFWRRNVTYRESGCTVSYGRFLHDVLLANVGAHVPTNLDERLSLLWFRPGWFARPLWNIVGKADFNGGYVTELGLALQPILSAHGVKPRAAYWIAIYYCLIAVLSVLVNALIGEWVRTHFGK